jgi:hypothetical protein
MAFRTPLLQPRSQYHAYWGRYAYTVGAGVWANGSNLLPGAPGNVISVVEFAKLEVGDTAATSDALVANQDLYVCVDVSGGNGLVEWRRLGNASLAVQTIRDAHVIVVGQDNTPFTSLANLFAAGSPPLPANFLNLAAAGEQLSITVDYLDTGDGAQLQLALSAAAAAGVGNIDIRLRPCDLVLTTATSVAALVIPDRCRLIGAGMELSKITGASGLGNDQRVVTMANKSSMEDLEIYSPGPTAAPGTTTGQLGIVNMDGAIVRRCRVSLEKDPTNVNARIVTAAIACRTTATDMLVDDCELLVDSLAGQVAPAPSYGVLVGTAGAGEAQLCAVDPEVRNTIVRRFGASAGAPHAVFFDNVEGGRCFNVEHIDAEAGTAGFPYPVIGFSWRLTIGGLPAALVRGPRFIECRVETSPVTVLADQIGFSVELGGGNDVDYVMGTEIHDCVVEFPNGGAVGTITKTGIRVLNSSLLLGTGLRTILNTSIDNCKVFFVRGRGIDIDASATNSAKIRSVRITACQALDALEAVAAPARGCRLFGNTGGATVTLSEVGVLNCDFSGVTETTAATGVGLEIVNARVKNTIATSNNLTPTAGAAFVDFGLGTEAGHNIAI